MAGETYMLRLIKDKMYRGEELTPPEVQYLLYSLDNKVKELERAKPISVLYVKKLTETAQIPTQGTMDAAGWDLYADLENVNEIVIHPGSTEKISTGISIMLPEGTFGAIYPRSGLATKQGLAPANKVGVVDSDYRGPVIVALHNHGSEIQTIKAGDRIAQLVVTPYLRVTPIEVDELNTTERGEGGFGSTGK